jgi:hypothetical protein
MRAWDAEKLSVATVESDLYERRNMSSFIYTTRLSSRPLSPTTTAPTPNPSRITPFRKRHLSSPVGTSRTKIA